MMSLHAFDGMQLISWNGDNKVLSKRETARQQLQLKNDVQAIVASLYIFRGSSKYTDVNSPTATSEHFGSKFEVDQGILLSLYIMHKLSDAQSGTIIYNYYLI